MSDGVSPGAPGATDGKAFSVCILVYGEHTDLARRCLDSIGASLDRGSSNQHVQDFRIGLNTVCDETEEYVRTWASSVGSLYGIPSLLYHSRVSAFKYPLMRRMFFETRDPCRAPGPLVMWFDDDSYLESSASEKWWSAVRRKMETCDVLGQHWRTAATDERWQWISRQPWFDPAVGIPDPGEDGNRTILFCQGGWWTIRREILVRYDWPIPELKHNGGDSLLGELCRQQGLRLGAVPREPQIRINADERGAHSKAERRGYSELSLGSVPSVGDLSHQVFPLEIELVTS